jgi:hypothetical protein
MRKCRDEDNPHSTRSRANLEDDTTQDTRLRCGELFLHNDLDNDAIHSESNRRDVTVRGYSAWSLRSQEKSMPRRSDR